MEKLLTEIKEGVDSLTASSEEKFKSIDERIKAYEDGNEKWKEDIAQKLESRKVAPDGTSNILAALDESDKKHIYTAERTMGGRHELIKDPKVAAALAVWMQSAIQVSNPQVAAKHAVKLQKLDKMFGDLVQKAGLQEDTDAEGGYLIPTILEPVILDLIEDNSVVRPLVSKIAMTTKSHDLPNLANEITAAWIAEEGLITDSIPANPFGKSTLTAKKAACLATVTSELVQDNPVGLLDYLSTTFAMKIGRLEDQEALEGDGTTFTGLSDATGVNSVEQATDGGAPSYAKLTETKWAAGEQATRNDCTWVMRPQIAGKVEGLVDDQSHPIFSQPLAWGQIPTGVAGYLLGYPLKTHSVIVTNRTQGINNDCSNAYFGPFRWIIFGDRTGISFGVSEHVNWTTDKLSVRMIKRTGILVALPAAFTKLIGLRNV